MIFVLQTMLYSILNIFRKNCQFRIAQTLKIDDRGKKNLKKNLKEMNFEIPPYLTKTSTRDIFSVYYMLYCIFIIFRKNCGDRIGQTLKIDDRGKKI